MKKNILILATGGTIAGESYESYYKAGIKTIDSIIRLLPTNMIENLNITSKQLCNIDSVEMNFKIWFRLYFEILRVIESGSLDSKNSKFDNIDSIIITHGTDTLEESAFFIYVLLESSLIKRDKSVIFTGSMRTLDDENSDVLANLSAAFKVASSTDSKGVLVVFDKKIFSAKNVVKTNMNDFNAFSSVNGGILGVVDDLNVKFFSQKCARKSEILSEFEDKFKLEILKLLRLDSNDFDSLIESKLKFLESSLPRVEILQAYADDIVGKIAKFLYENGAHGVVIAACGAGNITAKNKEMLESLMADSIDCKKSAKNIALDSKKNAKNATLDSKKLDSKDCIDSKISIKNKKQPFIVALSSRVLNGIIKENPLQYLESKTHNTNLSTKDSNKIAHNLESKIQDSNFTESNPQDSKNITPQHLNTNLESNLQDSNVTESNHAKNTHRANLVKNAKNTPATNRTKNIQNIQNAKTPNRTNLVKNAKTPQSTFITTHSLNPLKSRILLTLLLTHTSDKNKIQQFFLEM